MAKPKITTGIVRKTETVTVVKIPATALREILANAGWAPAKGVIEIFIDSRANCEEIEVDDDVNALQLRYVTSETVEETK